MVKDFPPKRRVWASEEDELMRRQSFGEFSMHRLEGMLKASRESIILRMGEMGLRPVIQTRGKDGGAFHRLQEQRWALADGCDAAPSVGSDKLLKRLHDLHGDRRY